MPSLILLQENYFCSHASALTAFLCPSALTPTATNHDATSSTAESLSLLLTRLSDVLLRLCLSHGSKPQPAFPGKGKVQCSSPVVEGKATGSGPSLKMIEAACTCLSSLVPYLINGLKEKGCQADVSAELSSLVQRDTKGDAQSLATREDVAFWASSYIIDRFLLPIYHSFPASLPLVQPALKPLIHSLVTINEERAASFIFKATDSRPTPLLPLTPSQLPDASASLWALRYSSDTQASSCLSSFLADCLEMKPIAAVLVRALIQEMSISPIPSSDGDDKGQGKELGGIKVESELDLATLTAEDDDDDNDDEANLGDSSSPLGMSPADSSIIMGGERGEGEASLPPTGPPSIMSSQVEADEAVLGTTRRRVGEDDNEDREGGQGVAPTSSPSVTQVGSPSLPQTSPPKSQRPKVDEWTRYLTLVSFTASTLTLAMDSNKLDLFSLSSDDENLSSRSLRESTVKAMRAVLGHGHASTPAGPSSPLVSSCLTATFKLWSSLISYDIDKTPPLTDSCLTEPPLTDSCLTECIQWIDELLSSSIIRGGTVSSSSTIEAEAIDLLGHVFRSMTVASAPKTSPRVTSPPLSAPWELMPSFAVHIALKIIQEGARSKQALVRASSLSTSLDLATHFGSRGLLSSFLSSSLISLAMDGLFDPDPNCSSKSQSLLTGLSGEELYWGNSHFHTCTPFPPHPNPHFTHLCD